MLRRRLAVIGLIAASIVVPLAVRPGDALLPVVQTFHGLTPARFLDTRIDGSTIDGAGVAGGALGPQSTVDVPVTGRGSVPISGVGSVALNITAVNPTSSSYITAYATGASQPTASNLNVTPGQVVANMAIVAVGDDGQIRLFNNAGSVDLVVDVLGWFPTGSSYTGLTPARVLEARPGLPTIDGQFQTNAPITGPGSLDLLVAGRGGVPASGVGSVALNVTVAGATSNGYVTVYPTGATQPTASNLNFTPGQVVPNMVIVPLGTDGKVTLFNNSGKTDLAVDVLGWFPTGPSYTGLTPARLLDSRNGQTTIDALFNGVGAVGPAGQLDLKVLGRGGVPASGVGSVALNVTATNPTSNSFITVWPTGADRPTASNINVTPGATVPNMVMVKIGADGQVSLFNNGGNTDLIVDVLGWFPLDSSGGGGTTTTTPGGSTTTTVPFTPGPTNLVSISTVLPPANFGSTAPSVSSNGRYVAFTSSATNLIPGDGNGKNDVFLRDTVAGTTTLISRVPASGLSNGDSDSASISADGRYVAFRSDASNLLGPGGDTNGFGDIFVRDTVANATVRVSSALAGMQTNADSVQPSISGNGQFVAFATTDSAAFGVVAGAPRRIIVRSVAVLGGSVWVVTSGTPNGNSGNPVLSDDGLRVAFDSLASNLIAGDSNGASDVFVRDFGHAISRVSLRGNLTQAMGASSKPSISGDGTDIAFQSDVDLIVGQDFDLVSDVYVYDVPTADVLLVSFGHNGDAPNGPSVTPAISRDGNTIAFASDATNLIVGDGNGVRDIFVGSVVGMPLYGGSVTSGGGAANGASHNAALSATGAFLAFDSTASNLGSDANTTPDVFIHTTGQ